ncbi:MAG TPA: hypothetical protein VG099_19705, partial [Gemmataceae bacterium]|nr:hypothetical protein [Gemmataceae bacterium]
MPDGPSGAVFTLKTGAVLLRGPIPLPFGKVLGINLVLEASGEAGFLKMSSRGARRGALAFPS